MLVREFMKSETIVARKGNTVEEAHDLMDDNNFRLIFVTDGDSKLSGFLTKSTLESQPPDKQIDDLLSRTNLVAKTDEPIDKAVSLIREHNLMVLPVVDDERTLQGILTPGMLFEDFSELLGLGKGGVWITLPGIDQGMLPSVVEIFDRHGASLKNILYSDHVQPHSPGFIFKVAEVEDKSSLQEDLEEAIL